MKIVLNILSVSSTLIIANTIIYLFLNLLFGRLSILNRDLYYGIKVKYILFSSVALLFILTFTEIYLPW